MAPASGPSSCAPCAPLAPRLQRDAKHAGHLLQPPGNEAAARASTRGGQRQGVVWDYQTHSRCTASRGPGGLSMRITDELCEAGSTFRYCVFLYSDNRS